MMILHRLLPQTPNFDFVGKRVIAFVITGLIILASVISLGTRGLNLGIDFQGGLLMEVRTQARADLGAMRNTLGDLSIGEVALQELGEGGHEVLIRVQRQPGDERAQMAALEKVRQALGQGVEYRRTELVGPKVGDELFFDGAMAMALSIFAIAVYVWFRFEWQYAIGAIIATLHDVVATVGLFSILGLEFNLNIVAAVLTIAGYSINDTVVEYDRVRENLRKYKQMPLIDLLNLSANEMFARTLITGGSTLLAVLALYLLGGEVLSGFAFAIIFGVLIGTYSSIYVAMPILYYFNLRSTVTKEEEPAKEEAAG